MARLNALLAAGARPVVGRMFEAGAAFVDAAPAPPPPAQAVLPFVGAILAYARGEAITVARRLALERDLYLADHNFVQATDVKRLADCFPVLPMTVSLEVMAQTAACLAPGYGLVGFDKVTARRWIAVADAGALDLRIEGRVVERDPAAQQVSVAVRIFTGDDKVAAVDATVRLASRYRAAAAATAPRCTPSAPCSTVRASRACAGSCAWAPSAPAPT